MKRHYWLFEIIGSVFCLLFFIILWSVDTRLAISFLFMVDAMVIWYLNRDSNH